MIMRELDDLRRNRLGFFVEFRGVRDEARCCAFVADCLGEAPRGRRALAISDQA